MYYPVCYQDDTDSDPYQSPTHHHQRLTKHHNWVHNTETAHLARMPSGQKAAANHSDGHNPVPYHHQRQTNPDHQNAQQQNEMGAYQEVPFCVYPYIPYVVEQPSRTDGQLHCRDPPDNDQQSPGGHRKPTSPNTHHYHHHHCHCHYHCHHVIPRLANHDNEGNTRCYYDHQNPPQPQPRPANAGNQIKHEHNGKNNDVRCDKHLNHAPPQLTTKWVWGPPLPGFVVGRPMDPKYKRG